MAGNNNNINSGVNKVYVLYEGMCLLCIGYTSLKELLFIIFLLAAFFSKSF